MSDMSISSNYLPNASVNMAKGVSFQSKPTSPKMMFPDMESYNKYEAYRRKEKYKKIAVTTVAGLTALTLLALAVKKGLTSKIFNKSKKVAPTPDGGGGKVPVDNVPPRTPSGGGNPPSDTGQVYLHKSQETNKHYKNNFDLNPDDVESLKIKEYSFKKPSRAEIDNYARMHGYKPVDKYEIIGDERVHIIYEGFDTDITEEGKLLQKILLKIDDNSSNKTEKIVEVKVKESKPLTNPVQPQQVQQAHPQKIILNA